MYETDDLTDEQAEAGLPHARGGVSFDKAFDLLIGKSSPRPWGCFQGRAR